MELGFSHAAAAGLAFIVGIGAGLLARNHQDKSIVPSSLETADRHSIPIEVPREVAIDVMIAERRELLNSNLALTKALATFSVAGMAASAALFSTTRAAHLFVYPAFMAFFLAFLATLFPYFDHSMATLRQFGNSFRALLKSGDENVTLPLTFPAHRYAGQNVCMCALLIGATLIAISVAVPIRCSLAPRDNGGLFGAYGESFCASWRVLVQ